MTDLSHYFARLHFGADKSACQCCGAALESPVAYRAVCGTCRDHGLNQGDNTTACGRPSPVEARS
jgi:hypothetical protein